MEWIDEVEKYLQERIKTGRTDAIRLLKSNPYFPLHMRTFIRAARDYIQGKLESVDGDVKAKLTPVSVGIGSLVLKNIGDELLQADKQVIVGDLFIEGFLQCGYVELEIPEWKASSNPIYIHPTLLWNCQVEPDAERHIRGIYSNPPGKLPLKQKVQFKDEMEWTVTTVKRWTDEDQKIFDTVVAHSVAHKSIEKLANTSWTINEYVLEAAERLAPKFDNKSKELEYKYTLQYAKQLMGNTFYYSPEFDYRGRIYFTMPFLNFQGADLARGLLLFGDKKYVNEDGLRWMKIHAACSFNQSYQKNFIPDWCTSDYYSHLDGEGLESISVDKMTLRDREYWVDNNWDLICETAEKSIIHDCEKPYSFLAVCKELYEYSNTDIYFSSLPIPVDGSNNGWQHLGAISKDPHTGSLVGLTPVDIQQDFYVQTAKALSGITTDNRRNEILSRMPMKHIRKGISKRGSMTRAYSAGAQKIAENMYQDCKKEGYHIKYGIGEKDCKGFARDLIKAINMVCPGPLQTMKYLQNLAGSVLEEGEGEVVWTTPSGFPVIYRCFHTRMPTIRSTILGCGNHNNLVGHKVMLYSTAPDRRGFMCGISPNYIHSQDAAHMQMVINRFDGDFGAVHDSFSTHASEVDDLLQITKEVFVEMYNHDNYFNKIKDKIGGQAEQPDLGSLDIKEVMKSDYFFA